jgi:hypothetical protein
MPAPPPSLSIYLSIYLSCATLQNTLSSMGTRCLITDTCLLASQSISTSKCTYKTRHRHCRHCLHCRHRQRNLLICGAFPRMPRAPHRQKSPSTHHLVLMGNPSAAPPAPVPRQPRSFARLKPEEAGSPWQHDEPPCEGLDAASAQKDLGISRTPLTHHPPSLQKMKDPESRPGGPPSHGRHDLHAPAQENIHLHLVSPLFAASVTPSTPTTSRGAHPPPPAPRKPG